MQGLQIWRNPGNKFTVARVHYTADPARATEEWYKEARKGCPSEERWQAEQEINFSAYQSGKSVYTNWTDGIHVREVQFIEGMPLYCGIDFGRIHPALMVTQLDTNDNWNALSTLMGDNILIQKFAPKMREHIAQSYYGAEVFWFCDPAGSAKSDKMEKSSIQILHDNGIYPRYRKTNFWDGINIIDKKLTSLNAGRAELAVHPRNIALIEGFRGGYRSKAKADGVALEDKPARDGYFEHVMDALRMIAVGLFTTQGASQHKRKWPEQQIGTKYPVKAGLHSQIRAVGYGA